MNALVRLALIYICAVPHLVFAQRDQSPPSSIPSFTKSLLRKIAAQSTPHSSALEWKMAAPYPTGIYRYGFAQNGDDFYIISGLTGDFFAPPITAVRRYNLQTNIWTSLADIPQGSISPSAAYYNGKIYVVDRTNTGANNMLRIYDIATNTWSIGPPPLTNVSGSAVAVFSGNIYFVNGITSIFNIATNTWSEGPPLPANTVGRNMGYAQIGQYLYMVGGTNHCGLAGCFNSDSSIRLDMASNTWSVGPAWTFRRADFALVAVGNTLVAMGGDVNGLRDSDASSEMNELDTSTWPDGIWVRSPHDLPSPRVSGRAGFFSTSRGGGEVWSTGGLGPGGLGFAERLNEHIFLPLIITKGGSSVVAAGTNGVLDPGETVTVRLGVQKELSTGTADLCTSSALTGTLQATGDVTNPSDSQNFGALCSGDSASRNFTFTVDPVLPCGADLTLSLKMDDGTANYGTLSYIFTTANLATTFAENFDGVVAPALPQGWEAATVGSPFFWATSTTNSDSPPNNVFVSGAFNQQQESDAHLDSPPIPISSAYTKVRFRHSYNLFGGVVYDAFDGGMLEVSSPNLNGGAFTDITDATVGGSFVTGGYDGILKGSNPLVGRRVWRGDSGGYITTIANLGPNLTGQTIRLRFRLSASGFGTTGNGWRVDSFSVQTPVCGGSAPAIISAVSRKIHGGAGAFDIDLPLVPLDGNIGIENRSAAAAGGPQIVVAFANPVTIGSASVTTGAGSVADSNISGSVVTIGLTGVTNAQRLAVTLSDVTDGVNIGSVIVPIGILSGDIDGNGAVNLADVSQTKLQSGQSATAANFRKDVTVNGAINTSDVSLVKSTSGTALP